MTRIRTRPLLVLVVVCVLAGVGDLLGQSGNPDGFGVGSFVVAAAAVVAILVNVLTDQFADMRKQKAELADQRTAGVQQPQGHLPLVQEIANPVDIGVHPAAPGVIFQNRVPVYIERHFEAELRAAIRSGGFTLLVGDAAAGKTRSAFEAMRAVVPGHALIVPATAAHMRAAVTSALSVAHSVLWLDDLRTFLRDGDGDGITRKDVVELLAGTGHRRVILATMRTMDESSLIGGSSGSARADSLIPVRSVLDQVGSRIFVDRLFNDSELGRARELAGTDDRLMAALRYAAGSGHDQDIGIGIGEYLASGPQIYDQWTDAWSRGVAPRAAALIAAAVDCRRAGFTAPLPRQLLDTLHEEYLVDHGGARLLPEDIDTAWAWALDLRESGSAPMQRADDDHYEVFGYLIDAFQRKHGSEPVPERVARAALDCADAPDAGTIAAVAWTQDRNELARDAFERQHALVSVHTGTDSSDDLDVLAVRSNRLATTLAVSWPTPDEQGLRSAIAEYRDILAVLADQPQADPGILLRVRGNLATVLSRLGEFEEAEGELRRALTEAKKAPPAEDLAVLVIRSKLATVLFNLVRLIEAEAEFRVVIPAQTQALGAEHRGTLDSRNNFGVLLMVLGKHDEAKAELGAVLEICRRVFGEEHPDTQMTAANLADVIERAGGG